MKRLYTVVVTQHLDPQRWESIALYLLVQSLKPPEVSSDNYKAKSEAYQECRLWGMRLLLGPQRNDVRPKLQRLIRLATPAKREVYQEFLSLLEEGGWLHDQQSPPIS